MRVARGVASGDLQEAADESASDPQRTALAHLKAKGKKQVVPNVRTGSKVSSRGLDIGRSAAAASNIQGQVGCLTLDIYIIYS